MDIHRKGSIGFTGVLTLLVIIFNAMNLDYSHKMRLIPMIIGIPTLAFLVAELIRGTFFLKNRKEEGMQPLDSAFLKTSFALAIFAAAVFIFGFFVTIPLFVFFYLLWEARLKWPPAMLSALITTATVTLLFKIILKVDLWPGVISEVISGYLGGGIAPPL